MKVRDYFAAFVDRKRPEVPKSTLDYYASHSRRFLAWLGPRADVAISESTNAEITEYRNHAAAAAGPTTTNNTPKAVKTFFAAARKTKSLARTSTRAHDGSDAATGPMRWGVSRNPEQTSDHRE